MKIAAHILIPLGMAAGTTLGLALAWSTQVDPVAAQCSRPSSCQTCHETQAVFPVKNSGDWHTQHAIYDFCADCHGGGKLSADAGIAHTGVSMDLNSMQPACAACHEEDYTSLLAGYAAQVGAVIDPNYTPPAPAAAAGAAASDPLGGFLGRGPVQVEVESPTGDAAQVPPSVNLGNLILSGLIVFVGSGGGGYVYWNERRKRTRMVSTSPGAQFPETTSLNDLISRLTPDGRDALEILLEDPLQGEDLLIQLALLEPPALKKLAEQAQKQHPAEN